VVGWSASEEPNIQCKRVYRVPNDQTRIQEQTLEKAARARMVGGVKNMAWWLVRWAGAVTAI